MNKIFKDISKLSPKYIPLRIPYRGAEFKQLLDLFLPVIRDDEPYTHVFIIGNPGVGKTMLIRFFERYLHKGNKAENIYTCYVNYKMERRPGNVIRQISSLIVPSMPSRGYSIEEMLIIILRELERKERKLLLMIDDADSLFYKDREFVYLLSRVDEMLRGYNPLSIIFVFHDKDALINLDPWTAGALKKNIIKLDEYSFEELVNILNMRVEEAFTKGAVPRETIKTCVDLSSAYGHNARYAIELLLMAGKIAEHFNSQEVKPEHIKLARDRVPPAFSKEDLKPLSLHEKIILYSLARRLLTTGKVFISMGDLEREYRVICKEIAVSPISYTWFWKTIKELSYYGLISKRKPGRGYRGRTTLIGLPPFSARFLEELLGREVYYR